VKNVVIVYKNFANVSKIGEALTVVGENIFFSTNLANGLQFLNHEKADLFIIDGSFSLLEDDLEAIRKVESEIIFIQRDVESSAELKEIGLVIEEERLVEHILHSTKEIGIHIASIKHKKIPNIFRDFDAFRDSITGEVRRAKRYRYPLVIVMFKLNEIKYINEVINYFSSKIREFDSLWISGDNKFSMILPHTGWNGAEILTNRLTTQIADELNFHSSALQNLIISFKRIESDNDFINRIQNSLNGKYYDINRDIDFNVWKEELFSEFLDGKTIRIFNRYKGMLISHDSDIILKNGQLEVYNIRPLQLSIINNEKATYFYSSTINKTIRAGIDRIDIKKSFATLSSFEIIDSSFIKNTTMKLLVEDTLQIKISNEIGKNIMNAKIIELSLDKATIIFTGKSPFARDETLKIEFNLPFNNEIYPVKVNATVSEIEIGSEVSYIDLQLATSLNDNMKISDFLSQKQIQFIKELKEKPKTF
jgi:hypothetical protein